jgi:hypothetical protein
MKPGDLFQYRGKMKTRRTGGIENPLLVFLHDYPGYEDYGIFLTSTGTKIQIDKDLLEEVEP